MIGQDRIAHADMASDTLVKPALGEDSVRGGQVLLAIQTFLFERVELGVCSNSQWFARGRSANGTNRGIIGGL